MTSTQKNSFVQLTQTTFGRLDMAPCIRFRDAMYDMAMGLERLGTGLVPGAVSVDGIEISVLESQVRGEDRPALVLVHGFGSCKEAWLRMSKHLKNDFHIIAVDLPGHGDSTKQMDKGYSLADQAAYLQAIIKKMDVERPHIAGNSMGASIIALYASLYPEEVASITLFNPAGVSVYGSEFTQHLASGENPLIIKSVDDYRRVMDFTMEKKIFLLWPMTDVLASKAIADRELREKIFKDSRLKDLLLNENVGFKEVLRSIHAPALIIWGRHDRLVDVKNARLFDKLIPDSRLVILEDVGHAPMLEAPRISAKNIKDFALGDGKN